MYQSMRQKLHQQPYSSRVVGCCVAVKLDLRLRQRVSQTAALQIELSGQLTTASISLTGGGTIMMQTLWRIIYVCM
ncbi:hypothetical protein CY34DRAFT_602674 [Suillus luteus UH-Slu-Lm8-n1]|uniref:Uncharacterized protein n=1 Tax=Suillus luteus UH-Slu-Lm8-n1 TaxID=930992 RepID=A0A0D0B450_9AGAM|nr:hypothetical protein CY34DRAFT_602674 [Suillus luteus UH-Slu-Lm8-n1]